MTTRTRSRQNSPSRSGKKSGNSAANGSITNYTTALKWLYSHTDVERRRVMRYQSNAFNLDRMRKLLKAMGDPHKQLRFVHVAGSKGKGSTVAMLSSMLRRCGYAVGTFTSPHLVDLRERIQVNGQMVGYGDLTEVFKAVRERSSGMEEEPTFFEIMTAAAIRHFADQAVDLAILETGLGGRLDSTNVVRPEVCAITQISLDHTRFLGSDLAQIAGEKAGILKKGVPAVTVEQAPEVQRVLRHAAEEADAPLQEVGEEIEFSRRFEANRELGPHTRICLTTSGESYDHLPVPLKGEHQALNCGLALAVLDKLRERGFRTPEDKLIEGLAETELPGRMEQVWSEPRVLLDGAHNGASIQALIKAIGAHVPYDSLVVIFGCAEDKDVEGMLNQVKLGADKVIFTRTRHNPRALEPEDLRKRFDELSGKMAQSAESLSEALNLAARAVGREDLICVTGSFHLVGEAKKYLQDLATKREKQRA